MLPCPYTVIAVMPNACQLPPSILDSNIGIPGLLPKLIFILVLVFHASRHALRLSQVRPGRLPRGIGKRERLRPVSRAFSFSRCLQDRIISYA